MYVIVYYFSCQFICVLHMDLGHSRRLMPSKSCYMSVNWRKTCATMVIGVRDGNNEYKVVLLAQWDEMFESLWRWQIFPTHDVQATLWRFLWIFFKLLEPQGRCSTTIYLYGLNMLWKVRTYLLINLRYHSILLWPKYPIGYQWEYLFFASP